MVLRRFRRQRQRRSGQLRLTSWPPSQLVGDIKQNWFSCDTVSSASRQSTRVLPADVGPRSGALT